MADPARPAFGPAHKVLVDGLTFCATTIIADDNFPLAVDLVAEAAAAAAPVGNPAIDGLAVAGRDLAAAWAVYRPQMAAYVQRAEDPTQAPSYGVPGDE